MKKFFSSLIYTGSILFSTFSSNSLFSGNFAYVIAGSDVNVIDTSTNTITATIALPGAMNPFAIAVTPNNEFVYVIDSFANFATVINTATNQVVATIATDANPVALAITPDSKSVYVVNRGADDFNIINTSTQTVTATIAFPLTAIPDAIAMAPSGKFAYVADFSGNVLVLNTATNTITATITGFVAPQAVAFTPDGQFAYVADDALTSAVSVVNVATQSIIATIPLAPTAGGPPTNPVAIAFTPNGQFAYVVNQQTDNVSVINTSTKLVVAVVTVGGTPTDDAIRCDGQFVYVTNSDTNNVSIISTATNTVVATISNLPGAANGVATTPCPFSPLNLECEQEKNDFGVVYELFNELEWDPNPLGTPAVKYLLFRDGKQIATLGPNTFKYRDHDRKKGKIYTYTLFAMDASGNLSQPLTIRCFTNRCCKDDADS